MSDSQNELLDVESHVENCPFRMMNCGRLTVEGYSRAAVQTYWRIPELKLGFDLGAQPWTFMGVPTYFLSHTHLDHVAALPSYVARRRMMKMPQPTIYAPASAVKGILGVLGGFSRLDRGRLPARVIGVEDGQEIELSRELVATAHATQHSVPSLGYVIWDRRRKLKTEYHGLPGDQIRDLRLAGKEVTFEQRIPILAYTGDTAPAGLDNHPVMYEAEVLITEMTFVSAQHRPDKIHKHGHMHLDDFIARRNLFQNQHVIASHFSTRYVNNRIERIVAKALPDMLDGRLTLWL